MSLRNIFSQLPGSKSGSGRPRKCSSNWPTKQYNAPVERIIKFVAAVYGLCTVAVRVYKWDGLRHLNWQ